MGFDYFRADNRETTVCSCQLMHAEWNPVGGCVVCLRLPVLKGRSGGKRVHGMIVKGATIMHTEWDPVCGYIRGWGQEYL